MTRLSFLGATGTVTGSKYLLEHEGFRLLVDCGLFQGLKELRERNWSPPPFEPSELDLMVLTHAHLDHSGFLPLVAKRGYEGRVMGTHATSALCGILLPDAGHIQEEDARFANKRGFSRHRPALPLYTEEEARRCLSQLEPRNFDRAHFVRDGIRVRFYPAGHILGAAHVEVRLEGAGPAGADRTIVFSGDVGRPGQPMLPEPSPLPPCDHLVLESTYGNRDHPAEDPKERLLEIVLETAQRGGVVLIPAFAVGRTQHLLYLLRELQREDRLPTDIPIHVDSPMAIHATRTFLRHGEAHDLDMRALVANDEDPLGLERVHLDSTVEQSKALNELRYPAVIISASGMATGGRVLHHLTYRLTDHRNTVLFAGYQAVGTRGRTLQEGAEQVKIHGKEIRVRAQVETLDGLSAHADRGELIDWLTSGERLPNRVHLVHGEPTAMQAMADLIKEKTGIEAHLPSYRETAKL